ncbi:MAG: PEP-CTERM sorting domain-containing protein [Burkholderiales bacterium]|nr:PEP-CTERM sorting domain-containing protein [Burkholderiales bacterium]
MALGLLLSVIPALSGAATYYGPVNPYVSFDDSPLSFVGGQYRLETWDSNSVGTGGYTITGKAEVHAPGIYTDSVDGDDGAIDGFGTQGHSLYVSSNDLTIDFDAIWGEQGDELPTAVGIVWTDVGFVNDTTVGYGPLTFVAYGPSGQLVSDGVRSIGDGKVTGETGEDTFFGLYHEGGISRIVISMPTSVDWEVDHLQFGVAVPEPSTYALMGLGLLGVAAAARRRRR